VILLDTHVVICVHDRRCSAGQDQPIRFADAALAEDGLAVSAISFWEIALLIAKRRLLAHRAAAEQRAKILAAGIHELPLTGDIALLASSWRICTATRPTVSSRETAIAHGATLMTADVRLLRWRHEIRRQNAGEMNRDD